MIGLIMGPQGSGKGTQAQYIQRDYNYKHCSMGDLLKAERAKGTEDGKIIDEIVKKGDLVPEEITNKIAAKAIQEHQKILFDGYPRNMAQAKFLIENNYKIEFIVVVEIGEEESVRRLGKRRICTANGKIFISDKITPQDIDECEDAGGTIITRDDDKPAAIKNRLKIYKEQTEPLIEYFSRLGTKIIRINGEQPIEKVYEDIKKIFN